MQPGGIITPGKDPETRQPEVQAGFSTRPEDHSLPPEQGADFSEESVEQDAGWSFSQGDDVADYPEPTPSLTTPEVSWSASEYMAHDKSASWYMSVMLCSVVVAVVIYFVTRDFVATGVMIVLGAAFAGLGARKPRVLDYALDNTGVHIGPRMYPYGMFRTFSIIEEDNARSILLMPLQRFNLPINLYFSPADEQRILEALSNHLPLEERTASAVDNLMRKIRF